MKTLSHGADEIHGWGDNKSGCRRCLNGRSLGLFMWTSGYIMNLTNIMERADALMVL